MALVKRHYRESAEISLIAVDSLQRGQGIGSALIDVLSSDLAHDGCLLLQVHTVGASFVDAGYAQTRQFYSARGFLPLEEFDRLDWDGPTLVMVKPLTIARICN